MANRSKSAKRDEIYSKKIRNRLILIPSIALIIKIFIIMRIQGFNWFAAGGNDVVKGLTGLLDNNYTPAHIWYGADGENYLRGLVALARDGFLSTDGKLSYWPAGYPLLMWPLLIILKGWFFFGLAIIQSFIYAVACVFFVDELRKSRLAKFALPVALILTFNPTVALNTIAIGYEIPAVALILIAVGAMMRNIRTLKSKILSSELLIASLSLLISTLMQPRLIVFAIVIFLVWGLAKYRPLTALQLISVGLVIVAIAPATMILRNSQANGYATISTNLGTTMGIGAGPEATGGYNGKYNGVPCPASESAVNPAKADSAKIKCILKWYWENPGSALKLTWNKSIYFWSPWFGPVANGTMARNPWRINHPLAETVKTESGFKMVYGTGGKLVSWTWMILNLAVMFYGFTLLWRSGNVERLLSLVALLIVLLNWASAIATIGDHRFRIPSMGMSLFLQVVGFTALFIKKTRRFSGSPIPISWPGLRWKRPTQTDNLPS